MQHVAGCLGCEIVVGERAVPGGIVHQTTRWIVNHAVGRLNLGTLIVAPRDHVVAVADLDDDAAAELSDRGARCTLRSVRRRPCSA